MKLKSIIIVVTLLTLLTGVTLAGVYLLQASFSTKMMGGPVHAKLQASQGIMAYQESGALDSIGYLLSPTDTTFFKNYGTNPFVNTGDETFSTFGMDVDTASYTITRRWLLDGHLPDKDSIRTEEFINYFNQNYQENQNYDKFSLHLEGAQSSFGGSNHLLRIGVKAPEVSLENRKPANMIFVVDVSGSMNRENRLDLVKTSLKKLAKNLKEGDQVGLVVYGSNGRKISDLTSNKNEIMDAINELHAEGSTNAEEGLKIAYAMARTGFEEGKINRIILASDGVANVGRTNPREILEQVKEDARKGITLTTLGFGMGNYNDVLMEQLANHGDGNYYYIDSDNEATNLFKDGATSLLQVVGSDAKIQVEFSENVERFRLLGYENRHLETKDFLDNSIDAGEVGAGQTVTALYEVKIKEDVDKDAEIATVRIRYMNLETGEVEQVEQVVIADDLMQDFQAASSMFKFTAGVAEFAEILKENEFAEGSFADVLSVIEDSFKGMNPDKEQLEFRDIVKKAIDLAENPPSPVGIPPGFED